MKIRITLEHPDVYELAVEEAAEALTREMWDVENSDGEPEDEDKRHWQERDERAEYFTKQREELEALLNKWFRYKEYLTVEIDTVAETIRVVPTGS